MSAAERKYRVLLFQEADSPLDELHGEVYRAGESEILGVVHGRAPVTISFDAILAGSVEVGERVDTEPARLQVKCFDRAPDAPGLRICLVLLEGTVGDTGGPARATGWQQAIARAGGGGP